MRKTSRDLAALKYLQSVERLPFASGASTEHQLGAKKLLTKEIEGIGEIFDSEENRVVIFETWITTGTAKELDFIRRTVLAAGGTAEVRELAPTIKGFKCSYPRRSAKGSFEFALVAAHHNGAMPQSRLLERICEKGNPKRIVHVGMMGGIPGKADVLDIVIPTAVYDGTGLGTENGEATWYKSSRPMNEEFAAAAANMSGTISDTLSADIKITKRTVAVGHTIEDTEVDFFKKILEFDSSEIIGMEMEGYAVVDVNYSYNQRPSKGTVIFGFVKTVADFGKHGLDDRQQDIIKKNIPELSSFEDISPRSNSHHKRVLQNYATKMAFEAAVILCEYLE